MDIKECYCPLNTSRLTLPDESKRFCDGIPSFTRMRLSIGIECAFFLINGYRLYKNDQVTFLSHILPPGFFRHSGMYCRKVFS